MFMVRDSDNISVKLEDLNVVLGDGTVLKRFVSQANFEGINKIRKKTCQKPVGKTNHFAHFVRAIDLGRTKSIFQI